MAVNSATVIGNLGSDPAGSGSSVGSERGESFAGDDRAVYGPQRREAATD